MSAAASETRSRARALLFDFGGTLDAEGVPWKDRFFRISREEGLEVPQPEFDIAFYGATDSLEGVIPRSAGFRETVERVAEGLSVRLARDKDLVRRIGGRFAEESLRQLEESAALLSRLSESYRIGIVSNFYGNLQAVCEETGLAPSIRVAVDSTLVGCKKPDPRIFRAALEALGASPAEAVFIGDSLKRDMAGARGLGMRHVWLQPEGPSRNGGPCCPGDPVIARLAELARLSL